MASFTDMIIAVARVLLSLIYLVSGFGKIAGFAGTAEAMAMQGVPLAPLALVLAILFEVGGGVMVLLGLWARAGALLLIVFTVLATAFFHDFWTVSGPERQLQNIMFMKNLSMIGGLLLLLVHGAGRLSLQRRLANRQG